MEYTNVSKTRLSRVLQTENSTFPPYPTQRTPTEIRRGALSDVS